MRFPSIYRQFQYGWESKFGTTNTRGCLMFYGRARMKKKVLVSIESSTSFANFQYFRAKKVLDPIFTNTFFHTGGLVEENGCQKFLFSFCILSFPPPAFVPHYFIRHFRFFPDRYLYILHFPCPISLILRNSYGTTWTIKKTNKKIEHWHA